MLEHKGKVIGANHCGITVEEMDKSLDFYCGKLGLKLEFDMIFDRDYIFKILAVKGLSSLRIAMISIPGSPMMIELLEYRGVERFPGSCRPCDPGSGHLCLNVMDLDDLFQRLKLSGVRSRSEEPVLVSHGPNKGAKVVYMMDPDGYIVELFEKKGL